ncbi:MAG: hypothetical protein QOG35_2379 [Solirubrobacteraceae bacterium]|jgi:hypothetical protein|nr:hypothetical protein [Solirubrobacteraceae bacterium]
MTSLRSPAARPPRDGRPLASLDGPSRTITVEPVETPVPAHPPRVAPEPAHEPERPPAPPRPAVPSR